MQKASRFKSKVEEKFSVPQVKIDLSSKLNVR